MSTFTPNELPTPSHHLQLTLPGVELVPAPAAAEGCDALVTAGVRPTGVWL